MKRNWRCVDGNNHYYYQIKDGKVIGQVYNLAHTIVWGARIPISPTEERVLGQYIEMEFAKKAIEEFWDQNDKTVEWTDEYLLPGSRP